MPAPTSSTQRTDLRFGIVTSANEASDQLRKVCEELSKVVGQTVTARVFRTFPELGSQMRAGELDIGWAQPLVAVELESAGTAAIALGVWRGQGSSYSSAIFVPASSSITRLEHLRGKRMAWVDQASAAGYLFPRLKLQSLGLPADKLFVQQTFFRTHEEVARAVFDGRAEAGAACVAFYPGSGKIQSAGWSKGGAHADSDVRILVTAGPIPTDAIVISKRLAEGQRQRIADGLMKVSVSSATREIVQKLFSGQGFVFIGSSQYEGIRSMLSTATPPSSAKLAAGRK